jgi:hypothetical protein
MNLKQRMEHQNKNNSSIINNSNFDFAQVSKEDQVYERSRRECEEELIKRKNELEYERANMLKIKEKELNASLDKFNADFEEIRKQIVTLINQHLTETKARMIAEIKERKLADTNDEVYIKKQIEDMLNRINTNLMGLRQSNLPPIQTSTASTSPRSSPPTSTPAGRRSSRASAR